MLLVLTALSLMTLDTRDTGPVATLRGAVMSVLSPFTSAADWAFSPLGDVWHGIFDYGDVEAENAELQARVAELEGQILREEGAAALLERWFEQTEIEFGADIEQVTARVFSGPASSFEETVRIDKGSDHGIQEGMAVVTGAGLVGRVEQVSANESIVMLLTDSRLQVGTRVVRTQEIHRLEGAGPDSLPLLEVRASTDLQVGDILQTSGLVESQYPPDIPVGRVVSIPDEAGTDEGEVGEVDEDDTTATTTGGQSVIPGLDPVTRVRAQVEPAARLDRLNFLTVLLWVPPT